MTAWQIPLAKGAQLFTLPLANNSYQFVLVWRDPAPGWVLDINDSAGQPIVNGIAVVPGVDLLAPYAYLGFAGGLYALTDGDPLATPTYDSLGVTTQLYFVSEV